jgi:transforming growth factor-beta-induced protein
MNTTGTFLSRIPLLAGGALLVAGCEGTTTQPQAGTLVEVAASAGAFTTLLGAAEAAGFVETLSNGGPFTLFAPTDAAFSALPEPVLRAILGDRDLLGRVLAHHVVPGRLEAAQVLGRTRLETVNGTTLDVRLESGAAFVGDARIVETDLVATNGVLHVIDAVLLPEAVLDLATTAAVAGGFETLLAAVRAAGLEGALAGPGPFTVFAPTDAAFAALPPGTVEGLLADPEALRAVLLYHVVPGAVRAADVVGLTSAPTLNGASLRITVTNGEVRIEGARVVAADIEASNGVIHVIDAVLIPGG